jgi:3-phosphoshikimate 1-carboxyvinyltransferase
MKTVRMPGDKSIAHRALILASLADGPCEIANVPGSADVRSTLTSLQALGATLSAIGEGGVRVDSPTSWYRAEVRLDCGNSGTTARLLAGFVTGLGVAARFDGDASLVQRPMDRVVYPLQSMGGRIEYLESRDRLPIRIRSRTTGALRVLRYRGRVASAQVKSALLLAGLAGRTEIEVREPRQSRDHTERLLAGLGCPIGFEALDDGGSRSHLSRGVESWTLPAFDLVVPGDISSAAFMLAAGLLQGTRIRIEGVGLNPTRTAFLNVLRRIGAEIIEEVTERRLGEPVGNLELVPGSIRPFEIDSEAAPLLIDEIPILTVLATRARGSSRIRGAGELRHKESDRISSLVSNLRSLGGEVEEMPDGLTVHGTGQSLSGVVRSFGDHRIAMAFEVLGRVPGSRVVVEDPECVGVSYPGFRSDLDDVAPVAPR